MLDTSKIKSRMTIKPNTKKFETCPSYDGQAKIVDMTDLKLTKSQYGEKETFHFIIEIPKTNSRGYNFTVWTRPFTMSLHEKSSLRAFLQSAFGEIDEDKDFDLNELVGAYLSVTIKNVKGSDGKLHPNIVYVSPAISKEKWESKYVRFEDREPKSNMVPGKEPVKYSPDVENVADELFGVEAS